MAAVVVVVAGLAYLRSASEEPTYAASADVLLSHQNLATSLNNISDPGANVSDYNRVAQTQADLATSPTVLLLALRTTGEQPNQADDLRKHSSVTTKPNADILTFRVEDRDPNKAEKLARAYATSYTRYRRTLDTAGTARALSEARQRIAVLNRDPAQNKALLASLRANEQRLSVLEALQTSNAFLTRAPTAASKVGPKPKLALALGLLFGAILGIGLALLRDALDTRVREPEEVSARLGLPLLATVPRLPRQMREEHALAMLAEPHGPHAEAFKVLRTNIDFTAIDRPIKTIMVTSAIQTEGKSTTAANLALAFARGGRRVVLVDLDLRRPYVAKFFSLAGKRGVTDVALGQSSLDEALTRINIWTGTEVGHTDPSSNGHGNPAAQSGGRYITAADQADRADLRVLSSGPMPPDTSEFLGSARLRQILRDLEQDADIVLVDAPPLLSVGDALTLSAHVESVLFVARLGVIRRTMFKDVSRALSTSPARVLGCVVSGGTPGQSYYDGYGYSATNAVLPANDPKPAEPERADSPAART